MQIPSERIGTCAVIFTVVAWMTTVAHSAETPVPPAAAGIIAQMDREIATAKAKAVTSLDKVLKETTKKGDLAGAMAVKEVIDQLKAETGAVTTAAGVGGNAPTVVGRWRWKELVYDFRPDASVKQSAGVAGKWQLNGKNLEVTWDNGYKYRLSMTSDGWVGIQVEPNGKESDFHLKREK